MKTNVVAPEISLLLRIVDEAYEKKAWHGPNLRGSIWGLDLREVSWRPADGRHNIWEIVVHCAYWKYAVRRRIFGEKSKRGRKRGRCGFSGFIGGGRFPEACRARNGLAYLWVEVLGRSERRLERELRIRPESVYEAALRGSYEQERWRRVVGA